MTGLPTPGTQLPVEQLIEGTDGPGAIKEMLGDEGLFCAFIKTECPTCELLAPYLDRIATYHGRTDLPVLIVSQNTPDQIASYAEQLDLSHPIHRDGEPYNVSSAFGVRAVPTCFRIDETGLLIRIQEGFAKAFLEDLDAELSSITGRTPANPFENAIDVPALRPG